MDGPPTVSDFKAAAKRAACRDFPSQSLANKSLLYGLFKQASAGDCTRTRPGLTDPTGRMKYDAWAAQTGKTQEQARADYVALVSELDPAWAAAIARPTGLPTGPAPTPADALANPFDEDDPLALLEPSSEHQALTAARQAKAYREPHSDYVSSAEVVAPEEEVRESQQHIFIRSITVPKWQDVEPEPGSKHTVYHIVTTLSTGEAWTVTKRYKAVFDLHVTLFQVNNQISSFRFPNRSMFNTFADHTRERRRTGFESYFKLLLNVNLTEVLVELCQFLDVAKFTSEEVVRAILRSGRRMSNAAVLADASASAPKLRSDPKPNNHSGNSPLERQSTPVAAASAAAAAAGQTRNQAAAPTATAAAGAAPAEMSPLLEPLAAPKRQPLLWRAANACTVVTVMCALLVRTGAVDVSGMPFSHVVAILSIVSASVMAGLNVLHCQTAK